MLNITLPDGSIRQFDHPVTVGEVAGFICAVIGAIVILFVVTRLKK